MGSAARFRVLVVDDDPRVHELVRHSLDAVEVVSCFTVAEALDIVDGSQAADIDAALIDVVLPDGSGFVVLAAVQDASAEIPVAMISAHDAPPTLQSSTTFLRKPLDADDVTKVVLDLIVR